MVAAVRSLPISANRPDDPLLPRDSKTLPAKSIGGISQHPSHCPAPGGWVGGVSFLVFLYIVLYLPGLNSCILNWVVRSAGVFSLTRDIDRLLMATWKLSFYSSHCWTLAMHMRICQIPHPGCNYLSYAKWIVGQLFVETQTMRKSLRVEVVKQKVTKFSYTMRRTFFCIMIYIPGEA